MLICRPEISMWRNYRPLTFHVVTDALDSFSIRRTLTSIYDRFVTFKEYINGFILFLIPTWKQNYSIYKNIPYNLTSLLKSVLNHIHKSLVFFIFINDSYNV